MEQEQFVTLIFAEMGVVFFMALAYTGVLLQNRMLAFSPNWIVGTREPDGTINYKAAARLTEDDAAAIERGLARQAAERKREAGETRNRVINLPNTAEKGTALRVVYTLPTLTFLAQERARLHPEASAPELKRARELQLEYAILHQAGFLWSQMARIEDEAKQRGEQLTYDQVIAKCRDMSALEMSERLVVHRPSSGR